MEVIETKMQQAFTELNLRLIFVEYSFDLILLFPLLYLCMYVLNMLCIHCVGFW